MKKHAHAVLDPCSSLADFSWKTSVPNLDETQDGLMLDLPHQA